MPETTRSMAISLGIIAVAIGVAYAPTPVPEQSIVVVSGSELQAPLSKLEQTFESAYPSIDVELTFQGSRDIVNRYLDDQNDFTPTVLIPANGELLGELAERWQAQSSTSPFYGPPEPIAKTVLVGVAWPERGNVLFPTGAFDWKRVEEALKKGKWGNIGGDPAWGSFDLLITDPSRSNSGQLALGLWSQNMVGSQSLSSQQLTAPALPTLFSLVKRSVYQPPRSTDVLLKEFIVRGPNDGDLTLVYESIALHRWQQAQETQGMAYQVYYLNPTIETVSTAAIASRNVNQATAKAAQTFLDFLQAPDQQAVFIEFGFRSANDSINIQSVPNSPWSQAIPGASIALPTTSPTPNQETLSEIVRLWQRAQ